MNRRKIATKVQYTLWVVFLVQVAVGLFVELPYDYWLSWLPALGALGIGLVGARSARRRIETRPPAPVAVAPPVTGRWSAVNSPADKVPSHGTHSLAQTYAIDIVAEPEEGPARPAPVWFRPVARRNRDYPAFGAPVYAVAAWDRRPRGGRPARPPEPQLARRIPVLLARRGDRQDRGRKPSRGRQPHRSRPGRRNLRPVRARPAGLPARPAGRRGRGRSTPRPLRELGQLDRAPCALPADGRARPGGGAGNPLQLDRSRRARRRMRRSPWARTTPLRRGPGTPERELVAYRITCSSMPLTPARRRCGAKEPGTTDVSARSYDHAMSDAFTVLWTQDVCRALRKAGRTGERPPVAFSGVHSSLPAWAGADTGDTVYALHVNQRQVYVVSRLRVDDRERGPAAARLPPRGRTRPFRATTTGRCSAQAVAAPRRCT